MDFTITSTDVQQSFERIARTLINEYQLQVNDTLISLCDLEFYWNDGAAHADPTTHRHDYKKGQLRPHGSGYDIALREGSAYGGILLRGIISPDDGAVYGPILSSDAIFKAGGDLASEGFHVRLKKRINTGDVRIFEAPRIGLKPAADDYHERNYRYLTTDGEYLKAIIGKEKVCLAIGERYPDLKETMKGAIGYTPAAWKGLK